MSTSEPKAGGIDPSLPLPYGHDGPRESTFATPVPATSGWPAGYPSESSGPGLPPSAAAGVPESRRGVPAQPSSLPDPQLMAAWANEFFKNAGVPASESNAKQAGTPSNDLSAFASLAGLSAPREPAIPSLGGGSTQLPFESPNPGFHVPGQVPVSSPVPQSPPLGPDPSQAGYYFLDQTQGRRLIPVNLEPYTRPLTAVTGPVPKAPAFFAQPLTHPSGSPPVAAALANGVPLAANSGALPVMAGSAEPAWSAAQPALGAAFPLGPLSTPVPTTGAGLPPMPVGTGSLASMSGADFSGISAGGFPVSVPGIGNDFSTGGLPTHGNALPLYGGTPPVYGGGFPGSNGVNVPGAAGIAPGQPSEGSLAPATGGVTPPAAPYGDPTRVQRSAYPSADDVPVETSGYRIAPTGSGTPSNASVAPASIYGAPAGAYGATPNAPGAPAGAAPSTYGAASNAYGSPASTYGAPANGYTSPDSGAGQVDRAAAHSGARVFEFQPLFVPETQAQGRRQFDVDSIRRDFPILQEIVHGKRLVWLDNAATTQKPQSVIDRISSFYEHENSNVHRAAHTLAARSTDAYENAREAVRRFLNAPSSQDIVWVRGTTEAVNLVAQSWGKRNLLPGDEIVISWVEHHSNIVPWQQLCAETGAKLKVAPVDDDGQILLNEYERLFTARTKLASFTHVSNALGTILPVKEMTDIAHRHGARVLVDGAQAVSHMRVDVQAIGCDFYAFSGHKVFGPTGIGALFAKQELLESMPPWQGGGSMIVDVRFDKTVYSPPPTRFEAGTGNIADAVGLGAAIEYVERIGMDNIARHEHELLEYGTARLLTIPRLRLIGTAKEKAGVMGFVIDGVPTETVGGALSKEGIAVRAGHHCAQPALRRYGLETTVRPSLALYNNREDIDKLIATLLTLQSNYR